MGSEYAILTVNIFSIVFLICWLSLLLYLAAQFLLNIFSGKKRLPFVPTPVKVVDQMIEFGKIKPGDKIIDLGSGIGNIVIRAAKKLHIKATGVERDFVLHSIAVIRNFFTKKRGGVKLIHGDMLKQNLTRYNVVMLFVTGTFINKFLKKKFENELPRGTKIISYVFRLKSDKFKEQKFETERRGFGKYIYVYTKK